VEGEWREGRGRRREGRERKKRKRLEKIEFISPHFTCFFMFLLFEVNFNRELLCWNFFLFEGTKDGSEM
jgi:hypothetical protein